MLEKKAAEARVSGSQVLISAEGIEMLREREEKKQKEKSGRRKQEKLNKEKEKDDLAKTTWEKQRK